MSNVAQNFRDSCRSGSPVCPGIGVTIARIICQPDRDPQITCSTHYYPEFRHSDIKVFHNIQLPSVLAQLAAESTFIPPQLARLKIAIYRNKIQYKELDTKQRCNKTRTMTQSIDSTPSKVTRTHYRLISSTVQCSVSQSFLDTEDLSVSPPGHHPDRPPMVTPHGSR